MDVSLLAPLKALEDKNRCLEKTYAEERLKTEIVQEALTKSGKAISPKRDGQETVLEHGLSVRLACAAFTISESWYHYQPKLSDENIDLIQEYRTRLIADVVTGKLDVRGMEVAVAEEPPKADTNANDFGADACGQETMA